MSCYCFLHYFAIHRHSKFHPCVPLAELYLHSRPWPPFLSFSALPNPCNAMRQLSTVPSSFPIFIFPCFCQQTFKNLFNLNPPQAEVFKSAGFFYDEERCEVISFGLNYHLQKPMVQGLEKNLTFFRRFKSFPFVPWFNYARSALLPPW